MTIPAGTEWMAAMTTTGTPASSPPTSGSRSTRATKTPEQQREGDAEDGQGDARDDAGDHRREPVPQHVARHRADRLVDDPAQTVRRGRPEEAEEPGPQARGFQHGEEGEDGDRRDGDERRDGGGADRERGGRLQHLGDLGGELGRPLGEVLLQVQAEDEPAQRAVPLLGLPDERRDLLAEVDGGRHQRLGEQVDQADQHQRRRAGRPRGRTRRGTCPLRRKKRMAGRQEEREEEGDDDVDDDGAQHPQPEDEGGVEVEQEDHRRDRDHDRAQRDPAAVRTARQLRPPGVVCLLGHGASLAASGWREALILPSGRASMRAMDQVEPGDAAAQPQEEEPPAPPEARRQLPAAQREDHVDGPAALLRRRVHPAPRAGQRTQGVPPAQPSQLPLADPRRAPRGGGAGGLRGADPHRALPRRARPVSHLPHQHVGPGHQPHAAGRHGAGHRGQLPPPDRFGRVGQHRRLRAGHPGHRLGRGAQRDLLARRC